MVDLNILLAVIVFSVLVFIHEFGHFVIAKKNGVRVIEFSIGFGPRLFSFDKGNTKYSIKLIPFGGACMMLNKELMAEGEENDYKESEAFESKSVWQRMAITLAGPIFNFILAFVLAIVVIGTVGYDKAEVNYVNKDSSAYKAGIREGDVIIEYNGADIDISRQIYLQDFIHPITDEPVKVKVLRDGEELEFSIVPKYFEKYVIGFTYAPDKEKTAVITAVSKDGPLEKAGVEAGDLVKSIDGTEIKNMEDMKNYFSKNQLTDKEVTLVIERDGSEREVKVTPVIGGCGYDLGYSYNTGRVKTSALGVIKYSAFEVEYQISTVFKSLGMLFTGQVTVKDFSGPVGIADYVDEVYQESKSDGAFYVFLNIANLTMLLSANLGVMNLLPIPGLDGGRFLFQIIEAIIRKPVKHEEYFHMVGMILLMIFAVFVLFQDIFKLFK